MKKLSVNKSSDDEENIILDFANFKYYKIEIYRKAF